MNHAEFTRSVLRTTNSMLDDNGELLSALLGLSGETGEVLDLYKKHLYQGHTLDKEKVMNEIGDVLYYLYLLAYNQGFTIEGCMEFNRRKLEKRYPVTFESHRSINRP